MEDVKSETGLGNSAPETAVDVADQSAGVVAKVHVPIDAGAKEFYRKPLIQVLVKGRTNGKMEDYFRLLDSNAPKNGVATVKDYSTDPPTEKKVPAVTKDDFVAYFIKWFARTDARKGAKVESMDMHPCSHPGCNREFFPVKWVKTYWKEGQEVPLFRKGANGEKKLQYTGHFLKVETRAGGQPKVEILGFCLRHRNDMEKARSVENRVLPKEDRKYLEFLPYELASFFAKKTEERVAKRQEDAKETTKLMEKYSYKSVGIGGDIKLSYKRKDRGNRGRK